MATQERQALQELETRVRQLMLDFRTLRADNLALQRQVAETEARLETEKARAAELSRRLDALRTARVISMEEGDVKEARAKISRMIREVDKCIALLA
ncbi:MAG: hypothetical protein IJS89_06685 [Bacteroidaceae bacterium]|nr:hypothetical protein [Bacteroidaceae bacterium]